MREAEILKAVMTAWASVTNSSTLINGGLHTLEAENDNIPVHATKWAVMECDETGIVRETNGGPIREHVLTIRLKTTDGIANSSSAMDALATIRASINRTLDNGGTIIDMWPHPAKSGKPDDQRQGLPVHELAFAYRIQSRWPY